MTLPQAEKSLEQGIASAKAGNLVLARMHLQQAVALSPDDETIWLWLAWVAESPASACQCLQKILDVHPNHSIALLGLEWAEAMKHFSLKAPPSSKSNVLSDSQDSIVIPNEQNTDVLTESGRLAEAPPAMLDDPPTQMESVVPPEPPPAPEVPSESKLDSTVDEPIPSPTESPEPVVSESEQTVPEEIVKQPEPAPQPKEHLYQRLQRDVVEQEAAQQPESRIAGLQDSSSDSHIGSDAGSGVSASQQLNSRPTILVVDDSPTVCKLVAMTLSGDRYEIISALDGVEAINLMAEQQPQLIFMDINMPRMDGYKLCKLVKKHESTKDIPVVMLSGKDGMFDRLRGRLVGCTDYITKPFDPQTLEETVERYLGKSASPV